jgi:hypothetical protein
MSSLLGFLGIILIFLPFLIFKNHGFLTLIALHRVCFNWVGQGNNMYYMAKKESPGDELITDIIKWIKNRLK